MYCQKIFFLINKIDHWVNIRKYCQTYIYNIRNTPFSHCRLWGMLVRGWHGIEFPLLSHPNPGRITIACKYIQIWHLRHSHIKTSAWRCVTKAYQRWDYRWCSDVLMLNTKMEDTLTVAVCRHPEPHDTCTETRQKRRGVGEISTGINPAERSSYLISVGPIFNMVPYNSYPLRQFKNLEFTVKM